MYIYFKIKFPIEIHIVFMVFLPFFFFWLGVSFVYFLCAWMFRCMFCVFPMWLDGALFVFK